MKPTSIILATLLVGALAVGALAAQVSSLQPATGVPGETATVGGSDWPETFQLLLGETAVPFEILSPGRLRFRIPDLPPGEYAVSLVGVTGADRGRGGFNLTIVAPEPIIDQLTPDRVETCRPAGAIPLLVSGRHFAPAARVLLDDAALAVEEHGPSGIAVTLPPLEAGIHRVQVVNPDGRRSLASSLVASDTPRIDQVQVGSDQVVSYQLRIEGSNFSPQSKLLVNGRAVLNRSVVLEEGDDSVNYIDCSALVYRRYPLTGQSRELQLQVQNPDGQLSNPYSITAY